MRAFQPFLKYRKLSLLFFMAFVALIILYAYKWQGNRFGDRLWEMGEPIATLLTFSTTLSIFYMQARSGWENSLEESLTIHYYIREDGEDRLILQIKNAYLSGESDIRQWALSLGGQVFGKLDFDMVWNECEPQIKKIENEYFKAYEVEIFLTKNPLNEPEKLNLFLNRSFSQSIVKGDLTHLPIIWERKRQEHYPSS